MTVVEAEPVAAAGSAPRAGPEPAPSASACAARWLGPAVALAALAAPFAVRAAGTGADWLACPLRTLTGVPCPTCGTTRAFLAVSALDLPAALAASPFGTALYLYLAGYVGLALSGAAGLPRPRLSPGAGRSLALGAVAATLVVWVARLALGWRG